MRNVLIAMMLSAAGTAAGDGMMFVPREVGRTAALVQTPAQEAVLRVDQNEIAVVLRTHFQAGPTQVAWLVPVPAEPKDVAAADEKVFTDLNRATAPRFYTMARNKPIFSCGCAASPSEEAGSATSVRVLSSGVAGVFDFHTLTAKRTDELVQWLTDNGYYVPPSAPELMDRYVKRGYFWLAMKIRPEKAKEPTLAPHPVTYRYAANDLSFPLVISRMNTAAENEIVLHVVAQSRYEAANWTNTTIDQSKVSRVYASESGSNYESVFRAAGESDSHVLITEFAGNVPREALPTSADWTFRYVTRLRGLVKARAMDRDIELRASNAVDVGNIIHLSSAASEIRELAWFGGTCALTLGLSMSILKGRWRFRSRGTR